MASEQIKGKNLKEGSRVRTWFMPAGTSVIRIEPYCGPLAAFWPEGARIVTFVAAVAGGSLSMTIGADEVLEAA